MYDLLIVGAGITAAALVARLKQWFRICVIDCRAHLGGNCFDDTVDGTSIHRYGPHIFHCPSPRIKTFLDEFTEWVPYTHKVIAEIRDGSELRNVPFPYCRQTAKHLGRELSDSEILDLFFRTYSQKMWGMSWEELPSSVRGRIPTNLVDSPVYYRDDFVALPKGGYTHMMENMFEGAELILGAPALEWTKFKASTIVYTGRPDLIPASGETTSIAQQNGLQLDFRTLDIDFSPEEWPREATSLHACSDARTWTRKTCFARMTGGKSKLVATEFPRQASRDDLTPYYPIELARNHERFTRLSGEIRSAYPNLHLAGRLGSYRYFDMYQAVGQGLALAERLWKK